MAGSAVGDNTANFLGAYHQKRILEVLENNTVFYQLADKEALPQSNGNVITFHTSTLLPVGSVITEGVQPDAIFMTGGQKTATIIQLGQVTKIADVMAKGSVTDLIDQAVVRLGYSSARTVDNYIQRELCKDGNISLASISGYTNAVSAILNGGKGEYLSAIYLSIDGTTITSGAAFQNTTDSVLSANGGYLQGLTVKKVRTLVKKLKVNNVRPYSGGMYTLVTDPEGVSQLRSDPEWERWNRYNNAEKMFKGEVGQVEQCRILETTNLIQGNSGLNAALTAHFNFILGAQAFAITEFSGDTGIMVNVVGFDTPDSGNVLKQNAFAGWLWTGVCKVLDAKQGYVLITLAG